jgi:hypothetical protein
VLIIYRRGGVISPVRFAALAVVAMVLVVAVPAIALVIALAVTAAAFVARVLGALWRPRTVPPATPWPLATIEATVVSPAIAAADRERISRAGQR